MELSYILAWCLSRKKKVCDYINNIDTFPFYISVSGEIVGYSDSSDRALYYMSFDEFLLKSRNQISDPKIPRTVDGEIIYPGMTVYICSPYAINDVDRATVYSVIADEDNTKNDVYRYWCVLVENRYYNSRGECWEEGDTEIITRLFANYDECRNAAIKKQKYEDALRTGTTAKPSGSPQPILNKSPNPTIYDKNQDLLRGSLVR
jgi:hypothetical protein